MGLKIMHPRFRPPRPFDAKVVVFTKKFPTQRRAIPSTFDVQAMQKAAHDQGCTVGGTH